MALRGRRKSKLWEPRARGEEIYDKMPSRVYIPEWRIFREDLDWLNARAERLSVSRSRALEDVVRFVFLWGLLGRPLGIKMVRSQCNRGAKGDPNDILWPPKLKMHRDYVEMLRADKEKRRVSWTIEIHMVIAAYRARVEGSDRSS